MATGFRGMLSIPRSFHTSKEALVFEDMKKTMHMTFQTHQKKIELVLLDSNLSFQEVDGRWFDHIALGAMKVGQDDHETVIQPQSFQGNDVRHIFIGPLNQTPCLSEKIPDKARIFQLLCKAKVSDLTPPSRCCGSRGSRSRSSRSSRRSRLSRLKFHGRHGEVRYGSMQATKSTTMIPFLKNAFVQYAGKKD